MHAGGAERGHGLVDERGPRLGEFRVDGLVDDHVDVLGDECDHGVGGEDEKKHFINEDDETQDGEQLLLDELAPDTLNDRFVPDSLVLDSENKVIGDMMKILLPSLY